MGQTNKTRSICHYSKEGLHITALSLCFSNVITFVVAGCNTLALKCVGINSDEVDQIPW